MKEVYILHVGEYESDYIAGVYTKLADAEEGLWKYIRADHTRLNRITSSELTYPAFISLYQTNTTATPGLGEQAEVLVRWLGPTFEDVLVRVVPGPPRKIVGLGTIDYTAAYHEHRAKIGGQSVTKPKCAECSQPATWEVQYLFNKAKTYACDKHVGYRHQVQRLLT